MISTSNEGCRKYNLQKEVVQLGREKELKREVGWGMGLKEIE
jgi:hypothetical protein